MAPSPGLHGWSSRWAADGTRKRAVNASAWPRPFPPLWLPALLQDQLTHGHTRLHVNATHFVVEAIESETGSVFDTAVLLAERKPQRGGSAERLSLFGQRAMALART